MGAFGEGSQDLHSLIHHLAISRVRVAGPQKGRRGQMRTEEAELALTTSFLRRTLSVVHPLLKGRYTGHEKTYSGDVNISPRLAETKRNQQFLDKSVLPFFLGRSRFWLFHLFFLLNPGNPPPPPPLVHAAATRRGGAGGGSPGLSRKNR